MSDTLPAFLTIDEAAEQLRVSRDFVHRLVDNGTIRAVRFGERTTRIPTAELDRLAGFQLAEAASAAAMSEDVA